MSQQNGYAYIVGKIPRRRKWQPTAVLLPGESHGGRSLVGYSPWGGKESSLLVVKNLPTHSKDLGWIPGLGRSPGGGNGNLLQYSCLQNPMNRGAWQATVYGVAKSQARLSDFTSLENYTKGICLQSFTFSKK